ncbi:MAG: DUF4265 domain-containing protein [Bryobacteraceae bacterium]
METSAAHLKTSQESVEIWFQIQKDDEGYPKSQDWEELWALPIEGGAFEIQSVPFFLKEIASGDVVSAARTSEGWYRFDRIISRSGNSNFRIWLHERTETERERIIHDLEGLGCRVEVTMERLIAMDVSPDRENRVWAYLDAGQRSGEWGLQIGWSPD